MWSFYQIFFCCKTYIHNAAGVLTCVCLPQLATWRATWRLSGARPTPPWSLGKHGGGGGDSRSQHSGESSYCFLVVQLRIVCSKLQIPKVFAMSQHRWKISQSGGKVCIARKYISLLYMYELYRWVVSCCHRWQLPAQFWIMTLDSNTEAHLSAARSLLIIRTHNTSSFSFSFFSRLSD